jgi:hypothetical protein
MLKECDAEKPENPKKNDGFEILLPTAINKNRQQI